MEETQLLPVVSPDTGRFVQAELEQGKEGNQYIIEILKRLQQKNPRIAEFLNGFTNEIPAGPIDSKDVMLYMSYCGALVYRLLEKQAEVDFYSRLSPEVK